MPREPKGSYLTPVMAGVRLIQLAVEKIFEVREGYKVKWSASVSYRDRDGKWFRTVSYHSGEATD